MLLPQCLCSQLHHRHVLLLFLLQFKYFQLLNFCLYFIRLLILLRLYEFPFKILKLNNFFRKSDFWGKLLSCPFDKLSQFLILFFAQSLDQFSSSLFILIPEFVPGLTELDELFLLFLLQSFELSFVDEIEEIFTSLILTLPDELNFLFGLFGLLVDGLLFTLFTVVVKKTKKVDDSRVSTFTVFILIVNWLSFNGELTQTKDEKKLVKGYKIDIWWLTQFVIDLD